VVRKRREREEGEGKGNGGRRGEVLQLRKGD
jgi:hypothetical protein